MISRRQSVMNSSMWWSAMMRGYSLNSLLFAGASMSASIASMPDLRIFTRMS